MNTRTTLLVLGASVLMGLLAEDAPRGAIPPQGPTLPVFYTGDHNAEVASCGCPKEDYGGVTRLAAFLDTLKTSGWEFLLVDAGDLCPFEGLDTQGRLKVETLCRAMALMGYDAVTLGDHDLAAGPGFVGDMLQWLGGPVLATNYDLPDGASERTRLLRVRGHRIGIVAFLDPSLVPDSSWVTVEPWEAQTERVQTLRSQCDVLIALVHTGDEATLGRFVDLYPDVDFVVAAHEGISPGQPFHLGKTLVGWCAGKGRYLGRAEIAFGPDGAPRQMDATYLPVVEGWGRRAGTDTLLARYYAKMRKLVQSDAFLVEREDRLVEPKAEYVGNAACRACHEPEAKQWEATRHAHAHATLVEAGKDLDPECQRCHTVGFGYRTGFMTPKTTPDRWNVGCESCHGPGAVHAASGEGPDGAVSEAACRGCHTPEHSPDFDYGTYHPRIVHDGTAGSDPGH